MTTDTIRVGGIVLCGGSSRRMGRSKAWLACGGEYLLQRMVRIVGEVVQPVVVAARPRQSVPSLPYGVRVVHDSIENAGPLAGIAAAFDAVAACCDAAFVGSCDLPLLRPEFVRRLIELLGDHPAVVPQAEDRLHPLAAVYRLETRAVLSDQLSRGELSAEQFAKRCGAHLIPPHLFHEVDPGSESLLNVNDPAAYERVQARLGR